MKEGDFTEERRKLAERLEDILVDIIERGDLDAFSNYLLDVSSLTWKLEYSIIDEETYALQIEEAKRRFMEYMT